MRRRESGEGSVFQRRSDGLWSATLELGWQDGKRQRKTLYGASKRQVLERLKEAQKQREAGVVLQTSKQTYEQLVTQWLTTVQKTKVAPGTYAREEVIVRRHLIPKLGKLPLEKVSAQTIQAYIAGANENHAPATVRLQFSVLHSSLEYAAKIGLIARNSAKYAVLPRPVKPNRRSLTVPEVQRLIERAADDPRGALYILAISTGMRIGELLALRWDDIDLSKCVVRVERKALHLGKQLIEDSPKSAAGRRTIDLTPDAAAILQRHRQAQREARMRSEQWERPDLVFTAGNGKPQRANNITSSIFPRFLREAGLPRITFHELRHSFISFMLSNGENISVVARIVGHSDVSMTLRRYRHLLPHEEQNAMKRYGDFLAAEPDIMGEMLDAD
jgi:integrase